MLKMNKFCRRKNYIERFSAKKTYSSMIILMGFFLFSLVIIFAAEGDYTNDHFDTSGHSIVEVRGMTTNGTFVWLADANNAEVYKFNTDGTFIDSFDTSGGGANTYSIATVNGTYL